MRHKIFIEAYTCANHGIGPSFAKVIIDDALVGKINFLSGLHREHGLTEVRVSMSPEDWGPVDVTEDLYLLGDELVVIGDGSFWFAAHSATTGHSVETRPQEIDNILKQIEEGVFIFGSDLDELRECLEDAGEIQPAEEA